MLVFFLSDALFSVGINSYYWQDGDSTPGTPIPLSSEHVSDEGIYLLENGEDCLVYIGNLVDRDLLQQLFGISSVDEIPAQVSLLSVISMIKWSYQEVEESPIETKLLKTFPKGFLFF